MLERIPIIVSEILMSDNPDDHKLSSYIIKEDNNTHKKTKHEIHRLALCPPLQSAYITNTNLVTKVFETWSRQGLREGVC
jgi:hypothetical protein